MFKCKNTVHTCIHIGNVCDGNKDCPFNDDEYLCEMKDIGCPLTCVCLLLALECKTISIELTHTIYPHISVCVYSIPILSLDTFVSHFPKMLKLSLIRTGIINICKTYIPDGIIFVDLGFNALIHLSYGCFNSLTQLRIILLENNCIRYINAKSFYHLINLYFLSLANNPLTNLPKYFITHSPCLKVIILKHNSLTDIDPNAFQNLNVEFIDTKDYHICCIAPSNAKCNALQEWYISCTDLLPHQAMRMSLSVISLCILLVNSVSILLHISTGKFSKAFAVTTVSINLNDVLCGLYLCIILMVDIKYQGSFLVREELWRSNLLCFIAFDTILLFSILGPLFLVLLSLSRLMFVIFPLNTLFKNTKFVTKPLFLISIVAFTLTLALTLNVKSRERILPFSLCLPFIDPTGSIYVMKVITWSVGIIQFMASFGIIIIHILLVYKYLQSQKIMQKLNSDKKYFTSTQIIVQLFIISLSNILCWIPANCVYILAMFLPRYPTSLVIWITMIVLPINSIVNPSVFIAAYFRKIVESRSNKENLTSFVSN